MIEEVFLPVHTTAWLAPLCSGLIVLAAILGLLVPLPFILKFVKSKHESNRLEKRRKTSLLIVSTIVSFVIAGVPFVSAFVVYGNESDRAIELYHSDIETAYGVDFPRESLSKLGFDHIVVLTGPKLGTTATVAYVNRTGHTLVAKVTVMAGDGSGNYYLKFEDMTPVFPGVKNPLAIGAGFSKSGVITNSVL